MLERLGQLLQPRWRIGVSAILLEDLDKALNLGVVNQAAHGVRGLAVFQASDLLRA